MPATSAEERAFPFRHPEEREHYALVELLAGDFMRQHCGVSGNRNYARNFLTFARDTSPSTTNRIPGQRIFSRERMYQELSGPEIDAVRSWGGAPPYLLTG